MLKVELAADPDFQRSFRASLRRRRAEVAFVILRPGGTVLTTTKTFYPSGIFRIPTGGVKPGEAVEEALWREINEETGLDVTGATFAALIEYQLVANGTTVRFATYLFVVHASEGVPHCSDPDEDICAFRELLPAELEAVAVSLSNLGANWRSWGIWRAIPHRVAAEILMKGNPGPSEVRPVVGTSDQ